MSQYIFPTPSNSFLASGGTVSGYTIFEAGLSANTFSANTIYSASTDLYDIFLTSQSSNILHPSFQDISVSGTANINTVIGQTVDSQIIKSGSTDLGLLFAPYGTLGDVTRLSNGINTFTAGTDNIPSINITGASFDNLFVSGTNISNEFFSNSLTGNSIFSGLTNLNFLFAPIQHTHIQYATLSGANFTGGIIMPAITSNTINSNFIYSGNVNISSIFQKIGQDYYSHVLNVAKSGASFTSVTEALNSITDNSISNRYIINIHPGLFIEDTLNLKPYVDLNAFSSEVSIIQVNSTNKNVINLAPNVVISNLVFQGSSDTGKTIFNLDTSFLPTQSCVIRNCSVQNTDSIFKSNLNAGEFGIVGFSNLAASTFNNGFDIGGDGFTTVSIADTKLAIISTVNDFVHIRGNNNRVALTNLGFIVQVTIGATVNNFVRIYNGSSIDIISAGIDGPINAINNENTGSGCSLRVNSFVCVNAINDLIVGHPNTQGNLTGSVSKNKVTINPDNMSFNLAYSEPNGGFNITGEFAIGDIDSELTQVNDLILYTPTLGKLSGGELSLISGFTISINEGTAYIHDIHGVTKYITWPNVMPVTIPPNSVKYVSVNEASSVVLQDSLPINISNVNLGKIITDSSKIISINNTPVSSYHYNNYLDNQLREAIGSLYVAGSIVSQNVSPLKIDISSGSYYFTNKKFTPTGGTASSFTTVYKSTVAGQYIYTNGIDTIPVNKYDDGSGVLATVPFGKWIQHDFYCNGDGINEKYFLVYAQQYFNTSADTINVLPVQPKGFNESIVRIASFIINSSGNSISSIQDRRPIFNNNGGGSFSTTAVSVHGNLSGLLADDHPQYLLTNGGRVLTGDLNLGLNNIISAGTVNGVNITSHASRHLPNGSDPLNTDVPISIGNNNNLGIANSFSRSDHQHAHGVQSGGTTHDLATNLLAGFLSSTDKNFIDSIPNIFNTKANLSGGTFTGNVNFSSLSGLTISGGSIFSGSTDLSMLFAPYGSDIDDIIGIQPGVNIFTGGTRFLPSINITSATLENLSVSGNSIFNNIYSNNLNSNSLSGSSIFSGYTDLSYVFAPFGTLGDITRIQGGSNIFTGGTPNNPTLNITSASLINLSTSGYSSAYQLSATTLSGNSIFSGVTDLSNLFSYINHNHPQYATLSGASFSGLVSAMIFSSSTLIGGSLFSGNTNLNDIFLNKNDVFVKTISNGINIFTDGNPNNPTLNITSATLNDLSTSGISTAIQFFGNSISGNTLYSGTTDLNVFFNQDRTKINTKANLSGDTFTGNVNFSSLSGLTISGGSIFSGNTNLNNIFAPTIHSHIQYATLSGSSFIGPITANTFYSGASNFENIFQQIGHDYYYHVVSVAKTGATFSSIKTALDSIIDNGPTKRYVVNIYPGLYIEDTLNLKQYVDLNGVSNDTVIIQVDSANKDVVNLAPNVTISSIIFQGSINTGKTIFNLSNSFLPNEICAIKDCSIGNTDLIFKSNLSSGQFGTVGFLNLGGTIINTNFNNGFDIAGDGFTTISIADTKSIITNSVNDFINIRGKNNRIILTNIGFIVQPLLGGSVNNFVRVYNGASVDFISVGVDGVINAVNNENIGTGSFLRLNSFISVNSTNDLWIMHPNTSGNATGSVSRNKVTIEPTNKTFNLSSSEPSGGFNVSGDFSLGQNNADLTKINDLITFTPTLGRLTGGNITFVSGFTMTVGSGTGYIHNNNDITKYVEWNQISQNIPANSIRYVTINSLGGIILQNSLPINTKSILLGKILSDSNGIISINQTPLNSYHYNNYLDSQLRDVIGTVYVAGSVVSNNINPLKIDISSGSYYFTNKKFTPTGGTAVQFTTVYKSNIVGQNIYTNGIDTIPVNKYDDGSGVLATVPSSGFTKHTLYCNGDGIDEKYFLVYAQQYYSTTAATVNGNIPMPPNGFNESIVKIASFVVASTGNTLLEIIDERPFFNGRSGGNLVAAVTVHGNLSGLLADDHPQYLLTNGGRVLTGDLNLGLNNIISAETINGINITSHASRHLPNGSDPLNTDVPISIGNNNNLGIANSFSRSDHQHAHGNHSGGTTHDLATNLLAGFLSSTDKNFIDSIPNIFNTKANLSGGTFTGNINVPSLNALNISGGTLYSGTTNLYGIFSPIIHSHVQYATLSGSSFTGSISAPSINTSNLITISLQTDSISANTLNALNISGGTLYSGTTNLYGIFSPIIHSHVQYATLSGSSFTGSISAPSISSTTVSSVTITSLSTIGIGANAYNPSTGQIVIDQGTNQNAYINWKSGNNTLAGGLLIGIDGQGNANIQNRENKNLNFYTNDQLAIVINSNRKVQFNNYTAGTLISDSIGNLTTTNLISATTFYSGTTDLSSIFTPLGTNITSVQNGINTYTGGSKYLPSVNITSATLNNLSTSGTSTATQFYATTLSASTLYSGSTNLYNIFSVIGSGGASTSFIQPGLNTYTGGTANLPSVNITSATLNNLSTSGTSTATQFYATTLSASTLYSGSTNLYNIFLPIGSGGIQGFTGTTIINFGNVLENDFAITSVTNSNITSNSIIVFRILNSSDHETVEDSLLEGIILKESDIVNGVGFNINAYAINGTWGAYNIFYKIIN